MQRSRLFRLAAILSISAMVLGLPLAFAATTTSNVKFRSVIEVSGTGAPAQGSLSWSLGETGTEARSFSNGSGNLAVNKVYVASAATTTNIDLDSTLTDPAGGSVTFSRIAYIRVIAGSANAANLSIGGDWVLTKYLVPGGDTLANVTIPVHPNGIFEFVAPNATGVAVTATTGDVFTITVSGSDTFEVVILGS